MRGQDHFPPSCLRLWVDVTAVVRCGLFGIFLRLCARSCSCVRRLPSRITSFCPHPSACIDVYIDTHTNPPVCNYRYGGVSVLAFQGVIYALRCLQELVSMCGCVCTHTGVSLWSRAHVYLDMRGYTFICLGVTQAFFLRSTTPPPPPGGWRGGSGGQVGPPHEALCDSVRVCVRQMPPRRSAARRGSWSGSPSKSRTSGATGPANPSRMRRPHG